MHETHLVIKIRPLLPSKDFYLHKEPINILQMNDRRAGTYLVRIYIIQPILFVDLNSIYDVFFYVLIRP
jgi:hypothetical protein